MDWSKEHVVVTGGEGFIGSHLVDRVASEHAHIRIVDNLSRGRQDNVMYALDIARGDNHQIPLLLSGVDDEMLCGGEIVFHLAAKVTGIHYNLAHNFDMMQSNLAINHATAMACAKRQPKLLIWVSTACVYPHDAPVPTPESCADICNPEPTNFGYGVAKWVGEQQARFLCKEYGIPTIIVRFFNAFGPRDYYDRATSHVAPALIRRVMEGENPLVVWGSGRQTRALVDARDIAKALVMLAEAALSEDWEIAQRINYHTSDDRISVPSVPMKHTINMGTVERLVDSYPFPWIVNIGHEREVSIEDLADSIINIAVNKYNLPEPNVDFDTSKPDGYPRRAADTSRLRSLIGWVPDTPLERTLEDMFEDYVYQKQQGWIDD